MIETPSSDETPLTILRTQLIILLQETAAVARDLPGTSGTLRARLHQLALAALNVLFESNSEGPR